MVLLSGNGRSVQLSAQLYSTNSSVFRVLDMFEFAIMRCLYVPWCLLTNMHIYIYISIRYILSSVWVRLSIFSQLSIIQYMGLCVFSLPIFNCDDWEDVHFVLLSSSNRKYDPLFRVRSWNNGIRCMFLYILITYPRWDWTQSLLINQESGIFYFQQTT